MDSHPLGSYHNDYHWLGSYHSGGHPHGSIVPNPYGSGERENGGLGGIRDRPPEGRDHWDRHREVLLWPWVTPLRPQNSQDLIAFIERRHPGIFIYIGGTWCPMTDMGQCQYVLLWKYEWLPIEDRLFTWYLGLIGPRKRVMGRLPVLVPRRWLWGTGVSRWTVS